MREKDRNLKREKHLRYKKARETKMWKLILLVLTIVVLLLGPGEKLKRPQKGKERKQKRESNYFNPSDPIPPMGPGL